MNGSIPPTFRRSPGRDHSTGRESVYDVRRLRGCTRCYAVHVEQAALAEARRQGRRTPIVVARLDRLSRDVHFISGLMTQRVRFISVELGPTSSRAEARSGLPPQPSF
jgi:hypothetical protein